MAKYSAHDLAEFVRMAQMFKIKVISEDLGLGVMYYVKIKPVNAPWYHRWELSNIDLDLIAAAYREGLLELVDKPFLTFSNRYFVVPA
jgi:hypothetical protein